MLYGDPGITIALTRRRQSDVVGANDADWVWVLGFEDELEDTSEPLRALPFSPTRASSAPSPSASCARFWRDSSPR